MPHLIESRHLAQWKIQSFRPPQKEVIEHVLGGGSALLLMPTGGGKSLCYQWPAAFGKQGLVLVVSPLIALMEDQQIKAKNLGIATGFINSSLTKQEKDSRLKKLSQNEYQLFFVTPERFRKTDFMNILQGLQLGLLAIDEAHCISQWGQDFRPEYSRLGEIRKSLGLPPVLALTATATEQVQADILKQLQSSDEEIIPLFKASIARDNLQVYVHDLYGRESKIRQLVALRHHLPGPGIIYFSLIGELERFSFELSKLNISHLVYHGQMSPKDRRRSQKLFLESDTEWILATPAFGLGVDKPNVRCVVHCEVPSSLESYFQEMGRAGRDGDSAEAHLLFDEDDVTIQMDFIKWATPDPSYIRKVYLLIKKNRDRIFMEGNEYLREQMHFYHKRDFRLETALNLLERWECIAINEKNPRDMQVLEEPLTELLDEEQNKMRIEALNRKLLQMVQWAKMTEGCRMQTIYNYFGEADVQACGHCDLCLAEKGSEC